MGISYGMAKVRYTVSPEHFQNNIRMQKMITLKQTSIDTVMAPIFFCRYHAKFSSATAAFFDSAAYSISSCEPGCSVQCSRSKVQCHSRDC